MTGFEPFAIAIAISEQVGSAWQKQRIKVFCTDTDEDRLIAARQMTFSSHDLKELSLEVRDKYFQSSGADRYSFKPDFRRSIIFGKHDALKDPVISKIDVLVSQNILVRHHMEEQHLLLDRIGTALASDGLLVLGEFERVPDPAHELFSTANLSEKVLSIRSIFERVPAPGSDSVKPESVLLAVGFDSIAVAQIVVDSAGRIAAANARARSTFSLLPHDLGKPLQDIELSYRPVELRSVIERASGGTETILINRVQRFAGNGRTQMFDVFVTPLFCSDNSLAGCSVQFHDVTELCALQDEMIELNEQLQTANEELQAAHEELETTNEELQSTNEELQTTNEELQSANEELETMNEELQSSNSELESINTEQYALTEHAGDTNSFLQSILGSLHAALLVLNGDNRVLIWSQRCAELWGLRNAEVTGKHLQELDVGFPARETIAAISALREGNLPEITLSADALTRTGKSLPVSVRLSPLKLLSENATLVLVEPKERALDG